MNSVLCRALIQYLPMKTIPVLFLMLISLTSMATIRTVNNRGGAQFTSLQAALDAATVGDTIYVFGSVVSYGDVTVRKRLILIGAGYKPINQQNMPSTIGTMSLFRDTGSSDPSGSVISGFSISSLYGYQSTSGFAVNNIRLFRNYIRSLNTAGNNTFASGWLVYNNIIDALAGSFFSGTTRNIAIQNNIIKNLTNFSEPSVLVDHNLFWGAGNLSSVSYVIFSNNIFVRSAGDIFSSVNYCTFTNNLSNQSSIGPASSYSPTNNFVNSFLGSGGGANTGGGNLIGVDPQFQSVTTFDTFTDTFNYRLRSTSPARNAGSDGLDLGIYAGAYPFPSGGAAGSGFDMSATPPIPQVTEMNIQNATVNPNGNITVQIRATVNN